MEYSSGVSGHRTRSKVQETSPLMFESDEEHPLNDEPSNSSNKENDNIENEAELKKEERILKGFQTVLMGIPPPPAFTVPQLDCREILKLWRENQGDKINFSPGYWKKDLSRKLEEEAKNIKWPDALKIDYWDVYYNKSSVCEEMEKLSVRYKERYVGVETSSCINALFVKSPSRTASARKRARNRAWGHSPGRRLSHLARRRKAFSSANLCSVAGNNNPDKKMIMVEIKKIGNRQKKKMSAKKTKPTPKKKDESQASNIKRALFQSPDQILINNASKTPSSQCIQRSKRNLFSDSSEKKNEFGKRERPPVKKISPRKRVNRSLSFHENSQLKASEPAPPPPAVPVTQIAQVLLGAHKQKMLWAATNALREENMGMNHELFRPCMTVLFRTCQKLWLTRLGKLELKGSTSERMLFLAKQFSSYIIKEISSDPTSEHMALVYNNCLKMGEVQFSQPSTSGSLSASNSFETSSKASSLSNKNICVKQKTPSKRENPIFKDIDSSNLNSIDEDKGNSSVIRNNKNVSEPMNRTPSGRKYDFELELFEDNVEKLKVKAITTTKNSPSTDRFHLLNEKNKNETSKNSLLLQSNRVNISHKEYKTFIDRKVESELKSLHENREETPIVSSSRKTPSKIKCKVRQSPRTKSSTITNEEKPKSLICSKLFSPIETRNNSKTLDKKESKSSPVITISKKDNRKACNINTSEYKKFADKNVNNLQMASGEKLLSRDTPNKIKIVHILPPRSSPVTRSGKANILSTNSLSNSPVQVVTDDKNCNKRKDETVSSHFDTSDTILESEKCLVNNEEEPALNKSSVCLKNKELGLKSKQTPVKKVTFTDVDQSQSSCQINMIQACDMPMFSHQIALGNKHQYDINNTEAESNNKKIIFSSQRHTKAIGENNDVENCSKNTFLKISQKITDLSSNRRVTRSLCSGTDINNSVLNYKVSSSTQVDQDLPNRNKITNSFLIPSPGSTIHETNIALEGTSSKSRNLSIDLSSTRCRITRRRSCDTIKSPLTLAKNNINSSLRDCISKHFNPADKEIDSYKEGLESSNPDATRTPLKSYLQSPDRSNKKLRSRRISCDTKSTSSVVSTSASYCSEADNSESLTDSPEFISPTSYSRREYYLKRINNLASSGDIPITEHVDKKNIYNYQTVNCSQQKADRKESKVNTPIKLSSSDDSTCTISNIIINTGNSSPSGAILFAFDKPLTQRLNISTKENPEGENGLNKENLVNGRPSSDCSDKSTESGRNSSSHKHLSSIENTPVNHVIVEEPVSRMLELYRISTSGGEDTETKEVMPNVECSNPPKLAPHWESEDYETEETSGSQGSPPSLTPHWELESCSGTSTSLPESIMGHWQQLTADANSGSPDKIMFDFEDTSYEITFPSINEDSRASSICAPFDFPFLIEDSKSCFNNVIQRSSPESGTMLLTCWLT